MEIVDMRIVPEFWFTDVFFYTCLEMFFVNLFYFRSPYKYLEDITNREKFKAPIYSPNISRYQ